MDAHTLELLGFPAIVERLKALCFSAQGPALLERQSIETDPARVVRVKELAQACRRLGLSPRALRRFA